jgi:hypothetical protein
MIDANFKSLVVIGAIVVIGYMLTRPSYRALDMHTSDRNTSDRHTSGRHTSDKQEEIDRQKNLGTVETYSENDVIVGVKQSKLNMSNIPLFEPQPQPGPKLHFNDIGVDVGFSQKRHGETPSERISVPPIKEDLRIYPASDMLRRELKLGNRASTLTNKAVTNHPPPSTSIDASIAPLGVVPRTRIMPASSAIKADAIHPKITINETERSNPPNRTCLPDARSCNQANARVNDKWSLKPSDNYTGLTNRVSIPNGIPSHNLTQASEWSNMSDPSVDIVRKGMHRGVNMPMREHIQPPNCSDISRPERTGPVDTSMRMPALGSAVAIACQRIDENMYQHGNLSSGMTKESSHPEVYTNRRGDTQQFPIINRKNPINSQHTRDAQFSNTRNRTFGPNRPGIHTAVRITDGGANGANTTWTLNDTRCDNNMTSTGIGSYGRKPAASSTFDISSGKLNFQIYSAPAHGCERAPRAEDIGNVNASGDVSFTPWTIGRLQPTSLRINPVSTVDKKLTSSQPRSSLARVFDEKVPEEGMFGVSSNRIIEEQH